MKDWKGLCGVNRRQEKVVLVLAWLYEFDFSTKPLLCKMLGVSYLGQGKLFKALLGDGYICEMHSPLIKHGVFCLTKTGHQIASNYCVGKSNSIRSADISPAVQVHDLTVQMAVLDRLEDVSSCRAERHLRSDNLNFHGKYPDALIEYQGRKIAIEVELSRKSDARVFRNYLTHLVNIGEGIYHEVVYLFGQEGLRDNYLNKYLSSPWPIYRPNKHGHLCLSDDTYEIAESHKSLIEFVVEKPYGH